MHELSIAIGIVEAVTAEAEARGLGAISRVHVRVGALAGVEREALEFSFAPASEGTAAAGATLVIEEVPILVACASCGSKKQPKSLQELACPGCGSTAVEVVQGRELELCAFEAAEEVRR